jgi:metal-dependent hydrolase (beta-lactamase superfamily II)
MSSHELAREILKHRDTNIKISVLVAGESPEEECEPQHIELRDHPDAAPDQIDSDQVVKYFHTGDYLVIHAGIVFPQNFSET